ncbi:MAG: hypothetical protein HZA36_01650 [Parcubacteria group bacterium]|nr:hypothetical protein [Parcubacteria group bacterium]
MKHRFVVFIALVFLFFLSHTSVFAGDGFIKISPLVIDEKAKPRDIIKESITLTNTTNSPLTLFSFVEDIVNDGAKVEFLGAKNTRGSLANWISFPSTIDIQKNEKRSVDFLITVNPSATPGRYHAFIALPHGSVRQDIEGRVGNGAPQVLINLEVLDSNVDLLQLQKFISTKSFFIRTAPSFEYGIENAGTRTLAPTGEINIYDARGEEVATLNANNNAASIEPGTTSHFVASWEGDKNFGRYKARLNVAYQDNQHGSLQDSVFFWVVPQKILLISLGILFVIILLFSFVSHRFQ